MDFKNKVILAPMAGVTDHAFRMIARQYGADYCVSEMISAAAVHYKDKKTASLAKLYAGDAPVGVQIFGHSPEFMGECARLISTNEYDFCESEVLPDVIDINMGCPVKKIVSSGDGSALMKNSNLCRKIISECVQKSSVPVTVKIRAGWDENSVHCVEIAKIAQDCGVVAITVHARTREQLYAPSANWDYIKAVKNAVDIPVIGNGDIFTAEDALNMFEYTGCDSVMVGRGALGNPFIFKEIKCKLANKSYTPPTNREIYEVIKAHVSALVAEKGERIGVCEARKVVSWYTKGMPQSAIARRSVNYAATEEEIYDILSALDA